MSVEKPKFMKPLDLFLQRKRKNGCVSPQAKKKFMISPLKCIDLNSPIKDSQGSSLNENSDGDGGARRTPRKGTPSKRILTPRKTTCEKSPFRDIKNENNRSNHCAVRTLRSRKTRKNLFKSPEKVKISSVTLHDENANIEPPIAVETTTELAGLSFLPIDWTLKTRMRFVSTKSFPFRGIFSSRESASATTAFTRCLSSTISKDSNSSSLTETTSYLSSASIDSSVSTLLRQNCFVWTFPSLPGYELYPRINNRCKLAPISDPMSDDLMINYCESLRDLYDLLRSCQCAYFYVCGNTFTALFRAAGVGGLDEIHAIITPTTVGFRTKLEEEGVEFTMPILEKELKQEKQREEEVATRERDFTDEQKGEENLTSVLDDDDASNFLNSLGIDPSESQKQNPKKQKSLHNLVFKSPLVLVKGVHTHGLIPFLSNRLFVLARTESLARVPPTLISPVAFAGANLQYLKPKYNRFVENNGESFNLEIKGPILPTMVKNLCDLFQNVLGDFKLYLSNYEKAAPMNEVRSDEKKSKEEMVKCAKMNLRACGLADEVVESLCEEEKQALQAYTTIFCERGRYFPS
ncbi:protein downstream neighbor of Son-like [Brevipalpus obovatus]|uniref:protein downstream neighbor of Son-like n=1 Tax=Brevipalpus obovatus TaxID=246614 RepID=UPI003D9DDC7E